MALMELLKELVERNASDLHLVAAHAPVIRADGRLIPVEGDTEILEREAVAKLFEPFLSAKQMAALKDKQDIHTSVVSDSFVSERYGEARRFRACIFWDLNGVSASLRVIPVNIPTLSQLFPPETEATFRRFTQQKRGLILVVGATGSGKSTTTASMIETINIERRERIFTIEEPIEYLHTSKTSLISQREVGTDLESFEQGGLSAFRSDPDVILVGEIRTPEALRIALALAETGHLVFSTIHADSVSEAVRRMIESFPDARETMQSMIARSLNAIIGQRLVPRAGGFGRVAAHEIMIVNSRIRRLIDEGKIDLNLAIEAGRGEGMCTMDDSLLGLYRNGSIDYDRAWNFMSDRDRLGARPVGAGEDAAA